MTATLTTAAHCPPDEADPLRADVVALRQSSGWLQLSLRRHGPMPDTAHVQLRTGAIRCWTIRVDMDPDEVVAALGLSGADLPADAPGDLVAAVALAAHDRTADWRIPATAHATRRVLAGIGDDEDHAQHSAVWPDPARYHRCHAAVNGLLASLPVQPAPAYED